MPPPDPPPPPFEPPPDPPEPPLDPPPPPEAERALDSMSLSFSSPIRSLLSLPDDALRVAELPMPSSFRFPRSERLLPELPDDPPEPPLDEPLCEEPDRPAASKPPPCCDPLRLDCESDEPDDPLLDDPLRAFWSLP
jgi:hypothetical protein